MSDLSVLDHADRCRHLQALYPDALPEVYGYLRHRTGDPALAEDLAAEAFLQAARSLRDGTVAAVTTAWLVTVARNKLIDHWRKEGRAERALRPVEDEADGACTDDRDAQLDAILAMDALRSLGAHHRAALTLRYVDDLPVAQVAAQLDRTVHATEALLVRARAAFRRAYDAQEGGR